MLHPDSSPGGVDSPRAVGIRQPDSAMLRGMPPPGLGTKCVAAEGSNAVPLTDEETSLDDLISTDGTPRNGQHCSVGTWYEEQSAETRASFDRHVAAGTAISRLWRACSQKGLPTGRCQFARHVNGECQCGPWSARRG